MKYSLNELYVSYRIGSLEDQIFTSKDEAIKETERINAIIEEHYPGNLKYRTMTLDDALWEYSNYIENK